MLDNRFSVSKLIYKTGLESYNSSVNLKKTSYIFIKVTPFFKPNKIIFTFLVPAFTIQRKYLYSTHLSYFIRVFHTANIPPTATKNRTRDDGTTVSSTSKSSSGGSLFTQSFINSTFPPLLLCGASSSLVPA